jgi:single-stranded-DNA-specific exonuclease
MIVNVQSSFLDKDNIAAKDVVDILLQKRNIKDKNIFLNPPQPRSFNLSYFGFKDEDIQILIDLLLDCYKNKRKVVVYTDYDADGITGGAILWETLYLLGFDVVPYVPSRKLEGYGFSELGIKKVKEKYDPGLIISVDHGIAAINQIDFAHNLGIPIVVTDHHHKQDKIPDKARAIFHIPILSGSATAFFVAKEIFEKLSHDVNFIKMVSERNIIKINKNFLNDYLALSSIGTIADLVPLTDIARYVVYHGLRKFQSSGRPGLKKLLIDSQIKNEIVTTYDVGFLIAPRINAVGRLDDALDALRLLCTNNIKKAQELSERVGDLNVKRQEIVRKNFEEAALRIDCLSKLPKIILIDDDRWHEGVIGLIASKLLDKYYRPAIVMTRSEKSYKASVRSIPGIHITDFLAEFKDLLSGFGGHAAAAGFTLPLENRLKFEKRLLQIADVRIDDQLLERTYFADIEMPLDLISQELYEQISLFEPFGIGNQRPIFLSKIKASDLIYMGKNKNHIKFKACDVSGKKAVEMVFFNGADKMNEIKVDDPFYAMYHIDKNEWNGNTKIQATVCSVFQQDVKIKKSII